MKFIFYFLFGIQLLACQSENTTPSVTESAEDIPEPNALEWDTLTTPYFMVCHPHKWTLEYDTLSYYGVVILSPRTNNEDAFSENLVCRRRMNENDYDIQTLVNNSISVLSSDISQFSLKEKNFSASTAKLIYSGEMKGLKMEWHQMFSIQDSTYTILTFTLEQKNTSKYLPYIHRMFNSYQLTNHELDH